MSSSIAGEPARLSFRRLHPPAESPFDQRDDLYYVDKTAGVYRCNKTSRCTLFSTGFGLPVNINFDVRQKHLWVADASGYIDAVDATTGKIVYQKAAEGGPTDPPFGIAPAPGG